MPREVDEWFWQVGCELNRLNEELTRGHPRLARARFWEPHVDLVEQEDRLIVKAEIAGVRGEDIQILYLPERHSLIVRGERREEDGASEPRTAIHQLEIYYGEFQREVILPEGPIDGAGITAQYGKGVLRVTIPKAERGRTTSVVRISRI